MNTVNSGELSAKVALRRQQNSKRASIYLMLLPNFFLFLVMSVYPVLWTLRYMFCDYDGISSAKFIGFENFIRVFTRDNNFWHSVVNTFIYAGLKILFILPLAFLVAVVLNHPRKGNGFLQAVVFSPTIMSSAIMSLVFYLIFNSYNGDVNRMLMNLHVIQAPIDWLGKEYAMATVIIVAIWGGLGNYMVYFLAGLQQVPKETYDSAELDGVNDWQRMMYITLPLLGPVLKIIIMLSIMAAFQDIQSIMVLTGGGPFEATDMMSLYIYQLFFPISGDSGAASSQYGYGAAVSVVSAIMVGIVTLLYLKFSKKLDDVY